MFNVYKYKYILELEQKYQNHFKLCSSNKIALLPPIFKKVGLIYYLAFPVIEDNINNGIKKIKRPIGVILINKNTKGKEQVFDLENYEFCKQNTDFNQTHYIVDESSPFWPNRNADNEENYRIILDNIQNLSNSTGLFKKPKDEMYTLYLNKLKTFIPDNYWNFYTQLEKNDIEEVSEKIKNQRIVAKLEYRSEKDKRAKEFEQIKRINLINFQKQVINAGLDFTKNEIVPTLKGSGSYTKLLFYNLLGKTLRKFKKESSTEQYLNCFNPDLPDYSINKNIDKVIDEFKVNIIKDFSKAKQNAVYKIISIDTISKVLIVFLNALFVEELKNTALDVYENEIAECISIYNEDKEKIQNMEARKFLDNVFEKLNSDYFTVEENKLSDIYYAYSLVHSYNLNK